jgi:ABC-2 type transport system ATP-binding protein
MVLSTHILPEVEQTCNRVIIIDKGKIVAVDTPQNLRSQVQGGEKISLEVEGPANEVASKLRSVPGVASVKSLAQTDGRTRFQVESELKKDVRRELARSVVQNGWGLLELQASTMSLEDIFIKLTTAETEAGAETAVES